MTHRPAYAPGVYLASPGSTDLHATLLTAVHDYTSDVEANTFPARAHNF